MDKRGKNFTQYEKNMLINIILDKKGVIENKETDGASLDKKKKAWEEVRLTYNSSQQSGERSTKQLKELYYILKRNARKNVHSDKVSVYFNT